MIPAALSSRFFCNTASLLASSNCLSLAFRLAFLPWVLARRARASESISFSEKRWLSSTIPRPKHSQLTIFIHVNRIRSRGLGLRVGINFTRPQPAYVVGAWTRFVTWSSKSKFLVLLRLSFVKEFLVTLQALRRRASDNGGNGSPLGWHELRQVEQLLVLCLRAVQC